MLNSFELSDNIIQNLKRNPQVPFFGKVGNELFTAKVIISNYHEKIENYFSRLGGESLIDFCKRMEIDMEYPHFGLRVEFEKEFSLVAHDDQRLLEDGIRKLVDAFGPVIFRNVKLPPCDENTQHKAIFSDLNFHRDRGEGLPYQWSLYYRDPQDPKHTRPRLSSTVFIPNLVAFLQNQKENGVPRETALQSCYNIFQDRDTVSDAIEKNVILEQRWDAPDYHGEVVVINNPPMFHASFYRMKKRGFRIKVRYLD